MVYWLVSDTEDVASFEKDITDDVKVVNKINGEMYL